MKTENINYIRELARVNKLPFDVLMAIVKVETPGYGFDSKTGKLLIQFEPSWFKKQAPGELKKYQALKAKKILTGIEQTFVKNWEIVISNPIGTQSHEWPAFNIAFGINPNAAMESTSIGLPQIMGFHWKRLGYSSVGAMWDDFKRGEYQQLCALVRFILTDPGLLSAVRTRNWHMIAVKYNGAGYVALARRLKREPYNISLEKEAKKWQGK